jgi:hypothetical protein
VSPSEPITLPFTQEAALCVLSYGASPEQSPYSHKQIAEWCDRFWCQYLDVDAPPQIERLLPVLADVDAQWDLFLVNTYPIEDLQKQSFENVRLPTAWFEEWLTQAKG